VVQSGCALGSESLLAWLGLNPESRRAARQRFGCGRRRRGGSVGDCRWLDTPPPGELHRAPPAGSIRFARPRRDLQSPNDPNGGTENQTALDFTDGDRGVAAGPRLPHPATVPRPACPRSSKKFCKVLVPRRFIGVNETVGCTASFPHQTGRFRAGKPARHQIEEP
jgi:hypothetical protein